MITEEQMAQYDHHIDLALASKLAGWITDRGGVLVWRSVDLSDPSTVAVSPYLDRDGDVSTKPSWIYANEPALHITDPARIGVIQTEEVKRFHVAVRVSSNGLRLKLTDASSTKLNKALEKAGIGATYYFDQNTQEAVILVGKSLVSLADWMAENVPA